jgi:hypothetical protein
MSTRFFRGVTTIVVDGVPILNVLKRDSSEVSVSCYLLDHGLETSQSGSTLHVHGDGLTSEGVIITLYEGIELNFSGVNRLVGTLPNRLTINGVKISLG